MAYGYNLAKTTTIRDGSFYILRDILVQRQLMLTMSPMVNGTRRDPDLGHAPCQTKLFFFASAVTMDQDGCTTGNRGSQYHTRDAESIRLNDLPFDVHHPSSIPISAKRRAHCCQGPVAHFFLRGADGCEQ